MKSFQDLVSNRRSSRAFRPDLLSESQVQILIEAALLAPSSRNRHYTQYVLVEERPILQKLSQVRGNSSAFIESAPLVIAVVHSPMYTPLWREDAAIAASYIQLQAEDLDLSSCWCQIADMEAWDGSSASEYVSRLLDIPYQMEVLCLLAIGYPSEKYPPHSKENLMWERVHIGIFNIDQVGEEQVFSI